MRRVPHLLVPAFAALLIGGPAFAQPPPKKTPVVVKKPEDELKAAIALIDKDDDKASAELERIYAARKDPRALYHLARAKQKKDPAGALRSYEKYLVEDPGVPTTRRTEIVGAMQLLMDQIALVTVTAPEKSTILIDDVDVGTAPLKGPVYVNPGSHKITAKRDEHTASKPLDAVADARITVELTLEKPAVVAEAPAAAPPPAEPPPPTPQAPSRPIDWRVVGGFGIAAVLAGGSAYFAFKASSTAGDFEEKKNVFGVSREELDSLQGDTQLQAGAATLLGVGALGVAGYTLFAFVLAKPKAAAPAIGAAPHVFFTGQGFVVRGGF